MTESEAINEIISTPKYYVGVLKQSAASNFIRSYRAGMAKKKTVDAFLEKFGYERTKEEQWGKAPVNTMEK